MSDDQWFTSPYDDICERLRIAIKAQGVIVLVVGGSRGSGASVRMAGKVYSHVPALLRTFAAGFEEEYERRNGPQTVCPACRGVLIHAEAALPPHRAPTAGDFLLCFRCASILKYETASTLRLATTEEIAELPDDERMALVRGRREIESRRR